MQIAGELTQKGHRLLARVYYEDTDFTGVVYHARYLHFFERGRTDFLRLLGIHHAALDAGAHGEKLAWVVRRLEIDFVSPARIDDILTIETETSQDIGGARITMNQVISRDGAELARAKVEAVLVNAGGRPRRFPKDWVAKFRSPNGDS